MDGGRLNLGWKHHPSLEIDFTVGSLLTDTIPPPPPFSFGTTIQSDCTGGPPIFWTLIGAAKAIPLKRDLNPTKKAKSIDRSNPVEQIGLIHPREIVAFSCYV